MITLLGNIKEEYRIPCEPKECQTLVTGSMRKEYLPSNLVEAHCYGKGMTGQFLSGHVAVKQIESKTFRPRRSSSVTILKKINDGA